MLLVASISDASSTSFENAVREVPPPPPPPPPPPHRAARKSIVDDAKSISQQDRLNNSAGRGQNLHIPPPPPPPPPPRPRDNNRTIARSEDHRHSRVSSGGRQFSLQKKEPALFPYSAERNKARAVTTKLSETATPKSEHGQLVGREIPPPPPIPSKQNETSIDDSQIGKAEKMQTSPTPAVSKNSKTKLDFQGSDQSSRPPPPPSTRNEYQTTPTNNNFSSNALVPPKEAMSKEIDLDGIDDGRNIKDVENITPSTDKDRHAVDQALLKAERRDENAHVRPSDAVYASSQQTEELNSHSGGTFPSETRSTGKEEPPSSDLRKEGETKPVAEPIHVVAQLENKQLALHEAPTSGMTTKKTISTHSMKAQQGYSQAAHLDKLTHKDQQHRISPNPMQQRPLPGAATTADPRLYSKPGPYVMKREPSPPTRQRIQYYPNQSVHAGMQQPRKPPRPPASSSPPIFKSLWSQVEKGLDGLATLDEKVAYRAQKLMHTAVHQPWRRPSRKEPPTRSRSEFANTPNAGRPLGTPQARWKQQVASQKAAQSQSGARLDEGLNSASVGTQPSVMVHPYAASSYSVLDQAQAKHNVGWNSKDNNQKATWNGLSGKTSRLMPSNGGASAPNDSQTIDHNRGAPKNSLFEFPNGPDSPVSSEQKEPVISETRRPEPQMQFAPTHPKIRRDHAEGSGPEQFRLDPTRNIRGAELGIPGQPQKPRTPPGSVAESFRANMAATGQSGLGPSASRPMKPAYPDEDDADSRISRILGAIPFPRFSSVRRIFRFSKGDLDNNYASLDAWSAEEADTKRRSNGFLDIFKGKNDSNMPEVQPGKKGHGNDMITPKQVQSLLDKSDNGRTTSLLSVADEKRVRNVGKSRAVLDVLALGFLLVVSRQLRSLGHIHIPHTVRELTSFTIPGFFSAVSESFDTWIPILFTAAMLTMWTNSILFDARTRAMSSEMARATAAEASYGRLFLRLVSSASVERRLPQKIYEAARLQVMALGELARLRSFVTYVTFAIVFMTVTFIRPFILTIIGIFFHIGGLEEWRKWPTQFDQILSKSKEVFLSGSQTLASLLENEMQGAGHHPMQVAFKVSILGALFTVACLPGLEQKRKATPMEDSEEENSEEVSRRMADQVNNLGMSSAGRLGLLSKKGWMESTLERWRIVQEESTKMPADFSISSLIRRLGYCVASLIILAMPLLVFGILLNVPVVGWSSNSSPQWESLLEVAVLLLFTNGQVWRTMARAVEANDLRPQIIGFLDSLGRTADELVQNELIQRPLSTSMNPMAGLLVKDFWAAHTVKRAWAVRGANLACRNGEVLLVLGDDGAGKSRLLTALAESMILPPKRALTTTKVRGSIVFGGIDITQWDHTELKKRVGLFLNDIRTMADKADMWSGMSLEEILEPGDGLGAIDPTHTSTATEKACMVLALKITGLYWSLLPRLPSKLSSVLTSNEEDLRPSPLRPRYNILSPTEWSKLVVAKLIAQQIFDNENSTGSSEKVDNSLIGSLFLLDDATVLLSEAEESKLLRELRRTGAATILTSNKWATGRLADKIVVVKDGSIVESGTHNVLLSRGPQQSLYAAKWQAMTSPS